MRIIILGVLTALAFAGNSLLNRAALADGLIDPLSFAVIRTLSAGLFLALLMRGRFSLPLKSIRTKAIPAFFLALYLVMFSLAYLKLTSALGALVLFAVVQFMLVIYSYLQGYRLKVWEWLGLVVAFAGVVVLLLPGVERPSFLGVLLMSFAGVGWACFTLFGLTSKNAIEDVTISFVLALPMVAVCWLFSITNWQLSYSGIALAIASGAIASGLGYYLWFLLLPSLSAVSAAAFQLLVPSIVAVMGVVFLAEAMSLRLVLSTLMVIAGLALFSVMKNRRTENK